MTLHGDEVQIGGDLRAQLRDHLDRHVLHVRVLPLLEAPHRRPEHRAPVHAGPAAYLGLYLDFSGSR